MLTKTSVINTISRLPDNFSIDEIAMIGINHQPKMILNQSGVFHATRKKQIITHELVDKMILLEKIEKGIQDADNGRVISETELEKQMEGW